MSDVTPPSPRLSAFSRFILFGAPAALAVLVGYGGWVATDALNGPKAPPTEFAHAGTEPDGGALYNLHCAYCHGVNGDRRVDRDQLAKVDPKLASPFAPEARHFGVEGFKFTDTKSGATEFRDDAKTLGGTPTDDRLVRLLRRGVKGSAMPSFDHLSEAELRAIVWYVRDRFITTERVLDRIGRAKELVAIETGDGWKADEDWSEGKKLRYRPAALADVYGSQPVTLPTPFPPPSNNDRRAAELYTKNCSGCHGPDGRGVIDPKYRNDNGTQAYPRNFAFGVFKGGDDPAELYRRVYLGIPGTPMKAFGNDLKPDEIVDLVYFVKRWSARPDGASTAHR